jgi:hypothetical protein
MIVFHDAPPERTAPKADPHRNLSCEPSSRWKSDGSFDFPARAGRIGLHVVGHDVKSSPLELFFDCRERAVIALQILRVIVGELRGEESVLVD